MGTLDRDKAIAILNRIVECELAGVIRYTQFSLTVEGEDRAEVATWLRAQADEGLKHAQRAGRLIALLGGQAATASWAPLLGGDVHDIDTILRASLRHETEACHADQQLLELSRGRSVFIEDYARDLIVTETMHINQVGRLMRQPWEMPSEACRSPA